MSKADHFSSFLLSATFENCLDLVYGELIDLVCLYQSVPHQFFSVAEGSVVVTVTPADGKNMSVFCRAKHKPEDPGIVPSVPCLRTSF